MLKESNYALTHNIDVIHSTNTCIKIMFMKGTIHSLVKAIVRQHYDSSSSILRWNRNVFSETDFLREEFRLENSFLDLWGLGTRFKCQDDIGALGV